MGRRAIIDDDWTPPKSKRPIATRLPSWLDDRLRWAFKANDEGPSVGLRRVVEEWWTRETFPEIEFREGPRGRQAVLAGGPEIWQVVAIWRSSGRKADGVRLAFPNISDELLEIVLEYATLFADSIEELIASHGPAGALADEALIEEARAAVRRAAESGIRDRGDTGPPVVETAAGP